MGISDNNSYIDGMKMTGKHITNSEAETIALGTKFAEILRAGDLVLFYGTLGAGKTEFIKGICDYFEVDEIVTSPTFTIINQYFGNLDGEQLPIYHLDLYRLNSQKDLDEIGFTDCIYSEDAIKLVEWAEKAENALPSTRYDIHISFDDDKENERVLSIEHLETVGK